MFLLTFNRFSPIEAIDVVLLHSTSSSSVLNRKPLTKENLFKYLHSKKVSVSSDFTKQLLIEKILQYWKETFYFERVDESEDPALDYEMSTENNTTTASQISTSTLDPPEQFPINQMARKFATWFFENLNANKLKETDFWNDCKCMVEFLEGKRCIMEDQYFNAAAALDFCRSLLLKYNLYFNLNVSHSGTQGRIDCHGLVLVLSCGTLHKISQFVGTFECVFGLSRDPFSENNWKVNQMNLRLHNFGALDTTHEEPTLSQSDSLQPLLSLTMPTGSDQL